MYFKIELKVGMTAVNEVEAIISKKKKEYFAKGSIYCHHSYFNMGKYFIVSTEYA